MDALAPLALAPAAEQLYVSLVEDGPGPGPQVAARCGLSPAAGRAAVDALLAQGLVTQDGEALVPLSPVAALERQADRWVGAARRANEAAREVGTWWSRTDAGAGYADFLRSVDACRSAELRVITQACEQVRSLTAGPLTPVAGPDPVAPRTLPSTGSVPAAEITEAFHDALARGVAFRGIYAQSLLNCPASLDAVLQRQRAGEEVRIAPELPVSMTLGDDLLGVAAYPTSHKENFHSIIARPSGLLDLMGNTFEIFWRQALPLGRPSDDLDEQDREVLSYLICGITDAAIANRIGISTRTVTRRVTRLQEQLGVTTRFQLGLRARERGWV